MKAVREQSEELAKGKPTRVPPIIDRLWQAEQPRQIVFLTDITIILHAYKHTCIKHANCRLSNTRNAEHLTHAPVFGGCPAKTDLYLPEEAVA